MIQRLLNLHGIECRSFQKLEGYDIINFKITDQNGKKYVLKQYRDNKMDLVEAESKFTNELYQKMEIEIPEVISKGKKVLFQQEDGSYTRVLDYLEGQFLSEVDLTEGLLVHFGEIMAQLHEHSLSFSLPAIEKRELEWDLRFYHLNRPKIQHIEKQEDKDLVEQYFELYQSKVEPLDSMLPKGIIHNDLNSGNVLACDDRISGIIDFGDVAYTNTINDIAIAMSYLIMINDDVEFTYRQVISGYSKFRELKKVELEVLPYLIPVRLAISVSNSSEAFAKGMGTDYIMRGADTVWNVLRKWDPIRMKV